MKLNIETGMFRLWAVAVVLIFMTTAMVSYPDVEKAAKTQSISKEWDKVSTRAVPMNCADVRGAKDIDWSVDIDTDRCWYDLPKLRKLYPEYAYMSDDRLDRKLYAKAGIPLRTGPIVLSFERVGIAALLSGALLLAGLAVRWIARGFAYQ